MNHRGAAVDHRSVMDRCIAAVDHRSASDNGVAAARDNPCGSDRNCPSRRNIGAGLRSPREAWECYKKQ